LLIRVEDIKGEGLVLDAEETAGDFPTLSEIIAAGECEFPAPLKVHLRAQRVGELVEVEGEVETRIRLSCSRCLKGFEMPLATRFALTFSRELPEVSAEPGEEEVEISAEEMGIILFHGEEIDLRDAVQEQVVMALPLRPLCDEGCRGLCPQCGADLNQGDCGCAPPPFRSKFDALKDFKPDK
jgi:uncharacterized protein